MNKLRNFLWAATTLTSAALLIHCSSGKPNPPPSVDNLDSSVVTDSNPNASGISITPLDIQFGDKGFVDCSTTATTQLVTLTNNSGRAVNFTTKLTAGSNFYTLSPDTLNLPAGGTGTIQVVPSAMPAKSAVTSELYAGNLEVTGKDPAAGTNGISTDAVALVNIRLHETARGAILTTTQAGTDGFGGVKLGTSSEHQFSVTNNGNVPAQLTFSTGTAVFVVAPTSATVGVSATTSQKITFTPTGASHTDTLTTALVGATPNCGDPIPISALNGQGSTSVGVLPGNLPFNSVNCGTTANPQTVTISSTVATTFTATFTAGTAYTLSNNATGTPVIPGTGYAIPAGDYVLKVSPNAIPAQSATTANLYGDTLTISTTASGDTPHVVQLTETAQGAILALNANTYNVNDGTPSHTTNNNILSVTNTGNATGHYTLTVSTGNTSPVVGPGPADTFGLVSAGTLTTNADVTMGTAANIVLATKTPPGAVNPAPPPPGTGWGYDFTQIAGQMTVSFTAVAGGALCAPAPAAIPLSLNH